ncbi:Guanine nucleotide-binding protein-like 1 [Pseudolycoriella hygida]|uniref:Guanine nucleotide-binding protein-like 1 n=1 Tax=Pseudolycoriella hygida TaxID=35572 RepID=A0A9Q0MMB3_9DIPT|nr:Guanine nucleotide-binding protein-like 1 [Pseudolycoriella hygida]
MPNNRRPIAYSGKKKKVQLLAKRQKNDLNESNDSETDEPTIGAVESTAGPKKKVNFFLSVKKSVNNDTNNGKYALSFHSETAKEIKAQKEAAKEPLQFLSPSDLETSDEYFQGYDFPIRPPWTQDMSKEAMNTNENRYFTEYVKKLESKHTEEKDGPSFCELNLEIWRQLWRVLEISDIVLVIVDARSPSLQFPPSLFEYVKGTLNKDMILVLNKIDLVPSHIVLAWKHYFEQKYPKIRVILFTAYPSYNLHPSQEHDGAQRRRLRILRRRGKMRMAKEGAYQIQQACKSIVGDQIDINSWGKKIIEEMNDPQQDTDSSTKPEQEVPPHQVDNSEFDAKDRVRFQNGVLTIGCVGFPNVGKSSLLNALMGKKVVSVSQTPGHTKYFQTIFLTKNVRLCDCPGLVFPSCVPRKLQVLIGSYPVTQLREPLASVQYLAERVNLMKTLNVEVDSPCSAMDICDAWASVRGFLTAKTARFDANRAANHILRMAITGQIVLSLLPVGFVASEQEWQTHADITSIETIKALGITEHLPDIDDSCHDDDNDDNDDNENEDDEESFIRSTTNAFHLLDDDEDEEE